MGEVAEKRRHHPCPYRTHTIPVLTKHVSGTDWSRSKGHWEPRRPQCLQWRKGTQGTAAGFKQLEEKMNRSHRHRPNQREEKSVPRTERQEINKLTERKQWGQEQRLERQNWRIGGDWTALLSKQTVLSHGGSTSTVASEDDGLWGIHILILENSHEKGM